MANKSDLMVFCVSGLRLRDREWGKERTQMGLDAFTGQIGVTELKDRKQPAITYKVECLRGSSAWAEKSSISDSRQ